MLNGKARILKSQIVIPNIDVDENFIDVFGMKMLSGRSFSQQFKSDSTNFVVNEKAMHLMGMNMSNAIGKTLSFGSRKGTIIGVVKDFNFKPLQYAIDPLVLRLNTDGGIVVVRTLPGNTEATIKALNKIYSNLNPAYPFTYNFLDKDLDNLYRGEQQMGSIFNLFAILAIFISSLGLYGLSAFMAEQRTKEIGVRKVLGASVFNIVYLLSTNFTKLILIAVAIAIPVSWLTIDSWLKGFAYRIDISWVIFLVASLAALLIAWLTVSYESIKAAIANPVKSLRTE
ncbi:MAG: FtsX-like permease family protein [Segetibacter sp.]